jgi:hypothetical protein
MFQASVSGLYVDLQTGEPVVLLREAGGDRSLPIWVSSNEMAALALELFDNPSPPPRPLTHELVRSVVSCLDARVLGTVVCDLKDHIYRATLSLQSDSGTLEIDTRPSDGIVMALKFGAPICVAEKVVEERLRLAREASQEPEDLWDRLQQIRPEDLNTQSI